MKAFFLYATFVAGMLANTSCSTPGHSSRPLPPGHAKKVAGSKSAKPFAPGQVKKRH